jgi:GNAT superfamily N-acetyltransferase
VIAALYVDLVTMEENRHIAQVRISVLPAVRRQGIGTLLLEKASDITEAGARRLMVGNTTNFIAAGEQFMTAISAQAAMRAVTNQLVMAEVPDGLLQQWIDQGRQSSGSYRLGFWEGSYPHEALESMARIRQAMNEAPLDDLEVNDMEWTPEMIMQYDATLEARKIKRWTYYVQENDTGEVVGYTEMYWSPDKPALGQQGDTAVLRAHRNHGLGRWLKAEMLQKVQAERPEAALIRTGNANSNAPMLKINHELGFTPYRAETLWQVPLATVQSYLENKKGAA